MVDVNAIITDFLKVAELAGLNIPREAIRIEIQPAPHTPPHSIPPGKTAVYIFFWSDQCLKVGKVGANSHARYTSQHYNPTSCGSNLARSILSDKDSLGLTGLSSDTVGAWIRGNTDRLNILLDADLGMAVLSLLESFLQCRLKPRFEGFESQR